MRRAAARPSSTRVLVRATRRWTLRSMLPTVVGRGPEVPAADDDRVPAPADGGGDRARAYGPVTLDAMADGGIHDQLGGGFPRYATDARWLVPHFEQMLYDNAQLARAYLHACAFGRSPAGRIPRGRAATLDYMLRELTVPTAHSRPARMPTPTVKRDAPYVDRGRGQRRPRRARRRPPSTSVRRDRRTATGKASPSCRGSGDASNEPRRATMPSLETSLAASRAALLARRGTRPQPARDDKALAAWNGLAIAALAEAGRLSDGALHGRGNGGRRRSSTGCRRRPAAAALLEGRSRGRAGRARGPRHLAEGLAGAVRDDLRGALVRARARLADRILSDSPTRPAASSTPPTTTNR